MSSPAPVRALGTRDRVIVALWALGAFVLVTWRFGFGWPGFIVIGLATGLVFSHDRSLRGALVVTRDWIGLFAFLTAYGASRAIADGVGMPWQEQSVIAIDEVLGLGETWVHRTQEWIDWDAEPVWWEVTFPLVYVTHFLFSMAALMFLYVTDRTRWRGFMRRWVTLSGVGLVGYVLLPTVPPWMASENGTVDPVYEGIPRGWSYVDGQAIADLLEFGRDTINPVAAMPSLHAAYPMLLLLFFAPTRGAIGRFLLWAYCLHMGITVVITAQHWLIDVIAGWGCALAVHAFWSRREERVDHESPPSEAPPHARVRTAVPA